MVVSNTGLTFTNSTTLEKVNVYCPGCPPGGTSVHHGGRNLKLMLLCQGGVFHCSKNNAMYLKHFKPWVEIIRAR